MILTTQPLLLPQRRFSADPANRAILTGIASTWQLDLHNTRLAPGAFLSSIAELQAGHISVPMLFEHRGDTQLGALTRAAEVDAGLEVEGWLAKDLPESQRVVALISAEPGSVGLSAGFLPRPNSTVKDAAGIVTFTAVDLLEISVVSMPSNRQSRIHQVRRLDTSSLPELVDMLRIGELPAMPGRLAKRVARAIAPLLDDVDGDHGDDEIARLMAALGDLHHVLRNE